MPTPPVVPLIYMIVVCNLALVLLAVIIVMLAGRVLRCAGQPGNEREVTTSGKAT